jgi:hypothetical protein
MAVSLSALRTRRTLLPRNIIIFMFLVLTSVRDSKPQDVVRPEDQVNLKIDLIGYLTRNLPICSMLLTILDRSP